MNKTFLTSFFFVICLILLYVAGVLHAFAPEPGPNIFEQYNDSSVVVESGKKIEKKFKENIPMPDVNRNAHDYDLVLNRMKYWTWGPQLRPMSRESAPRKYIVFKRDCGGFNNIRMAFEVFVTLAYLFNRTLVIPPPEGWYLIDSGPFARMKPKPGEKSTVSDEGVFFDMKDMASQVSIVSTRRFIELEKQDLDIPPYAQAVLQTVDEWASSDNGRQGFFWDQNKRWYKWLEEDSSRRGNALKWGTGGHLLYYPSIDEVQKTRKPSRQFRGSRSAVELTSDLDKFKYLYFPSCRGDGGSTASWRYLIQVGAFIAFSKQEKEVEFHKLVRNNMHLLGEIFEVAAKVVSDIGAFKFVSLHVRRNELQYKSSFKSASESLKNIRSKLTPGETIYIATDEVKEDFFDVFRKEFKVVQWKDYFGPQGKFKHIEYSRKHEGLIEMAICSMGRIFFGTSLSTFSAYIRRLRGYVRAPDTGLYQHSQFNDASSSGKSFAPPFDIFHDEPEMWEEL
mmetsp:Transcript_2983/g.4400  ORF Transcript_2983/g.4400 Transcript_2983/m.4400 type:complete len:507 (-) Transcript_2983:35-1555(-)